MEREAKIYVAGHRGLAGSAILRALQAAGFRNFALRTHAELDLGDQAATRAFFRKEKPEYVFVAAARVGGVLANNTYPAEFIHSNLAVQTNVIHEAWRAGVRRLLLLGSSCIYPRECPQPMKEEHLLTGPLEPTNRPYALAKIAGVEMCWSYNRQYGTRFIVPMPTNLYGPGDNYDLQSGHVISALIRKFHEAKRSGNGEVTVWGTGAPRREFLHSDDMAAACLHLMEFPDREFDALFPGDRAPLINVGVGEDQSIKELAETVNRALGAGAKIVWDRTKPDGTPRKLLDSSKLFATGWRPCIEFEDGIRSVLPDLVAQLAGESG